MSVATINWNGVAGSTPDANSCQITYAAGDTLYDTVNAQTFPAGAVSTALNAFLTAHGWSRLTATSGSIATTAGLYAYTAPNLNDANGTSSLKYILLDFRTSGKIFCRVYETIGTDSTLTNLAYASDTVFGTVSTLSANVTAYSGKLWIGASARHFIIHSYSNGAYGHNTSNSGPIGCFEVTRNHPLDLATGPSAYPKFCAFYAGGYTPSYWQWFASPRNKVGVGSTAYSLAAFIHGASPMGSSSVYYPTLRPVSSPICIQSGSASGPVDGCLINVIALQTYSFQPIGEDAQIPVSSDSNYGNEKFLDPSGTLTSYWVLGGLTNRVAVPK